MKKALEIIVTALIGAVAFPSAIVVAGYGGINYNHMAMAFGKHFINGADASMFTAIMADSERFGFDAELSSHGVSVSGDCRFNVGGAEIGAEAEFSRLVINDVAEDKTFSAGVFASVDAKATNWLSMRFTGGASIGHFESSSDGVDYEIKAPSFAISFGAEAELFGFINVGGRISSYQHKDDEGIWFDPTYITNEVWAEVVAQIDGFCIYGELYHVCEHPELAWKNNTSEVYNRDYTTAKIGIGINL